MTHLASRVLRLLEGPNIAFLGTLMPDGSPQVTPVWIDYEGDFVLVNTAEGRAKSSNVRRDPRVAVAITAATNAYEAAMIRGRVIEVTPEGADEHIDKLAKKYLGQERYPFRQPGERRLIVRIRPDSVATMP
jgi:PPOX class probable F420-dependent enzyme